MSAAQKWIGRSAMNAIPRYDSFLKRYAHTIGVNRAELFCAPGLGLQGAIGVHLPPAFLIFGIHGLNALYDDSHHGLVSHLARQSFVAHAGYVQVGIAAVDSCVVRWRGIAKDFLEAADLRPPIQRFPRVGGRKNGDRAFDDRVHDRRIAEIQPGCLHLCRQSRAHLRSGAIRRRHSGTSVEFVLAHCRGVRPQKRATNRLPFLPGRGHMQPGGCLKMDGQIEKRIELQAPVSRVWRALSDYREFGKWFRVKLDGPFVPGQISRGQITYPGYEHVKWEAVVQKMEPQRLFSFTWKIDPKIDSKETSTLVEFRLEKTTSGTLLLLTESGFEKMPSDGRLEAFRLNDGGWTEQMKNIEKHVAETS